MRELKEDLLFYIRHLYLVDYVFILFVIFLFISVLLLVIFLRNKPILGLFIIAFDIVTCFFIFIYGYNFIDNKVRNRHISIVEQKIIHGSDSLVIDFNITNTSKINFKICNVLTKLYKKPNKEEGILSTYKYTYIPFRQKSIILKDLNKTQTQIQRISFENFNLDNNYTIKLKSECF